MQFTVIFACFFFVKFIEYNQTVNNVIIIYCKHSFKVTQTDYSAQCIFFSLVINVIIYIFVILLNLVTLFLLCTCITFSTMFSHISTCNTSAFALLSKMFEVFNQCICITISIMFSHVSICNTSSFAVWSKIFAVFKSFNYNDYCAWVLFFFNFFLFMNYVHNAFLSHSMHETFIFHLIA